MTKALLIGKDGRTDCIAEALQVGGAELHILSEIRNPGFLQRAKSFELARTDDVRAVVAYARQVRPDVVVVGPEEPLAAGVVDAIQQELGTPCFGPTKRLARLESSKSFTRDLLAKYSIPGRVEYRVFETPLGLEDYALSLGEFVVKPDGLTGGKGVRVFGDHFVTPDEGISYALELLREGGGPVVIEERLDGEEFSLQSFCDGERMVDMPPVQDHKRALEDDQGPNTGGMGTYSCADHLLPFLSQAEVREAQQINARVARALMTETGEPYRGVLYGGFMVTANGVKLIEYNARFGDPEAMNVIPLIKGNFLDVCMQVATGTLRAGSVSFRPLASVCKYVVPQGYPTHRVRGVPLEIPAPSDDWRMYYAAVQLEADRVMLTGSRALCFVATGSTVEEASLKAERGAAAVGGPVYHRRDIGTSALLAKRVEHMNKIRSRQRVASGVVDAFH